MKKICRTIKLRKFASLLEDLTLSKIQGNEFIVCFDDHTYKWCLSKNELRECLERDHIKGVRYAFDVTDRIIIVRDVLINTDEI